MNLQEIERRSALLLGFGVEGQATYEFLRSRFPNKIIAIADRRPLDQMSIRSEALSSLNSDTAVRFNCGPDYLDSVKDYEVIIKTPGIPTNLPALKTAEDGGAVITSHLEIFFELVDRRRIVGVTGTKGKSTTTSLLYKLLHDAGIDAVLGGNIGEPPLLKLDQTTDDTLFVLELSSYQLERLHQSPHIAVLLNIVPEHLDYHPNFSEYVAAKENITKFQDSADYLVYNYDYPLPNKIAASSLARAIPFSLKSELSFGCYVSDGEIIYSDVQGRRKILEIDCIPLLGTFNQQNVLAAVLTALILGASPKTIPESVRTFQSLPHRLEYIGKYNEIKFYNDSISTVPECTLSALDALGQNVQTLILGGHERHIDYSMFGRELLRTDVENVILFPPTGKRIWDSVLSAAEGKLNKIKAFTVNSMEQAVQIAFKRTEPGKICLLSPASPSFSNFRDYCERGDIFRKLVQEFSVSEVPVD